MSPTGIAPSSNRQRALIRSLLRPHRRDVTLGALLGVLHQVCEALVAVLIGVVIDRAIRTGDLRQLTAWIAVLVMVFVVLALAGLFGYYLQERAEETIAHDVRVRIADRVVDPRGGTDEVARPGEVLSLATSDAGRVGSIAPLVGGALSAVVVLLAGGAYLVATSWRLGAVVLAGLPVLVWLSQRVATPLQQRSADEQDAVAHASWVATDLIRGLRVLKGLGAEAAGSARYAAVSQTARDGRIHAARYLGLTETVSLTMGFALVVVVVWVGGRLALSGTISIGELVAAVGLAGFLVFPLTRLTELPSELAVVRASAGRLAELLDAEPAVSDGTRSPTIESGLLLSAVTAGPLRSVDLVVAPGEWVGVVAPDGRDAATLLDLLSRRVDPTAGTISLGGVDVARLRLTELRTQVLVSDHDAVLFEGTVLDNVGPHLDDVATASATDEVLTALPDGARSPVGERGRWLSGGQRQRVVLARALAADAAVLVLHDPTTAVDAATEHRIAGRMRAARPGGSAILVTTSPALLAACDRVVMIRDGAVVADGVHRSLADENADYQAAVLS